MKKQTKKVKSDKIIPDLTVKGIWSEMTGTSTTPAGYKVNITGTSDLHKVRQSVNQKVERSEEDVKKRFNEIMIPFLVFQVLNFLLLLTLVVR